MAKYYFVPLCHLSCALLTFVFFSIFLVKFTHITHFFGQKVILLGLYDGQRLEGEPEEDVVMYTRATEETFVRVLLLRGRLQGAVLVGETDLEEVLENLILSGIDLTRYGPEILDPEVDLEDYFD